MLFARERNSPILPVDSMSSERLAVWTSGKAVNLEWSKTASLSHVRLALHRDGCGSRVIDAVRANSMQFNFVFGAHAIITT
jgi:hypothetical protein